MHCLHPEISHQNHEPHFRLFHHLLGRMPYINESRSLGCLSPVFLIPFETLQCRLLIGSRYIFGIDVLLTMVL